LGRFVAAPGNHGADAALAEVLPDRAAAVALVPGDAVGPQARTPHTRSTDGAGFQQRRQGELLVPLAAGQGEDDRLAAALGADVDLGGEAAPAAPERLGSGSPFAPAACWWARTTDPSTK